MKKNIHSIDSLDKEIYRLKLEAKLKEDQLDRNWDYIRHNFPSLLANSFTCQKQEKSNGAEQFFESILKNESVNTAMTNLTGHLAARAVDGVDHLVGKIFRKKK